MDTQTPSEYLYNKSALLSTPYIITKDGAFFEYEGELIPEEQFIKMFPLANKVRSNAGSKGENIGNAVI